ncbi:MAG: alpha/beta fold hydrolase [Lachnospiraceae bacterium]
MYNKVQNTFESVCLGREITYYVYRPVDEKGDLSEVKAVVQLSHGMNEYVEKYEDFARFLTDQGIVFCGGDHLGHGATGEKYDECGFFAKRHGYRYVVEDVYQLTQRMKKEYGDIPFFLFGHSMGSFIARAYLMKYSNELSGCMISGTGGGNPMSIFGIALSDIIARIKGPKYVSMMLENLAFSDYNKGFDVVYGNEWLTRDTEICAIRARDQRTKFSFCASAYRDLMTWLTIANTQKAVKLVDKNMPILFISGDADPVGNYGVGVRKVYEKFQKLGQEDVTLKLYHGARHELLNEINRDEVKEYILLWMERVAKLSMQ